MPKTLTPRRRAILTALRTNGRPPSYREVAQALGWAVGSVNPGSIHASVQHLIQRGYVSAGGPRVARTLRLTDKGLLASQGYELIYLCDSDGVRMAT